ncbi:CBS domain-containing protein [Candidatus Micrarchaeota archaeon]|nr:CBS domain-containing protein [Candidatus Micrarchaeota archaeon]
MYDLGAIGKLRKKLSLTQKQLATLAGVSQSLIAKIESNHIDPAHSKVVQIMLALESEQNKSKKTIDQLMTPTLVSVNPSDSVEKAIKLMRSNEISQLPVFESGRSVGSFSDRLVIGLMEEKRDVKNLLVRDVMRESFPIVPSGSLVDPAIALLKFYRAVLVEKNGKFVGLLSKADLLKEI